MYSLDFRKQVFKIQKQEKLTFEQTSERFGIALRTLFNWHKNLEPKPTKERPAIKIDMERLKKHVEEYPDAYQYERAKAFKVSPWAILKALRRLGKTVKKNSHSSQKKRVSPKKIQKDGTKVSKN